MAINNINRNYNIFIFSSYQESSYPLACLNSNVEAIGLVDKKVLLVNNWVQCGKSYNWDVTGKLKEHKRRMGAQLGKRRWKAV